MRQSARWARGGLAGAPEPQGADVVLDEAESDDNGGDHGHDDKSYE